MPRWTKRDTRALVAQLETWALLHDVPRDDDGDGAVVAFLDAHRRAIVCAGLRAWAAREDERAAQCAKTAVHATTSGVWGSATTEVVTRFERLAGEHARDAARVAKLLARVEDEGEDLPPDVITWTPGAMRR